MKCAVSWKIREIGYKSLARKGWGEKSEREQRVKQKRFTEETLKQDYAVNSRESKQVQGRKSRKNKIPLTETSRSVNVLEKKKEPRNI